jgi:hypothetical protein
MNVLRYAVTASEVMKSNKWVSKVLQGNFSEQGYNDVLYLDIVRYAYQLVKRKVADEKLNELLYERVALLKKKFPARFPPEDTLGWYEKNRLCELFLEGRVLVDGLRYEEILAMQKEELRIRDEAREQLRRQEEEAARAIAKEEARVLAEKEVRRKEVVVGMLFRRKDGLVKSFVEAYPEGTPVSRIAKELPNLVDAEWVEVVVDGVKRKVWEVKGVKEDGRAWEEDLV